MKKIILLILFFSLISNAVLFSSDYFSLNTKTDDKQIKF